MAEEEEKPKTKAKVFSNEKKSAEAKLMLQEGDNNPDFILGGKPVEDLETLERKPQSYLWLSLLTALFLNFAFGIPALVLSILSDNAWFAGKSDLARRRGRYALILAVTGMVVSVILIIVVPVSLNYGVRIA